MNLTEKTYRKKRMACWNNIANRPKDRLHIGKFYHNLLNHYYQLLVPSGLHVLEIGCSRGDLLAALNPSFGVGMDFSGEMVRQASSKYPHLHFVQGDAHDIPIKKKFDIIVFSDLVNDLWDVQSVFEKLKCVCHSSTRLIINSYNNLWRIPLSITRRLRLSAQVLEQNWLSPQDISNLLALADFEVISIHPRILMPLNLNIFSKPANRYLVNLPPFKWFALTNLIIARTSPTEEHMPKSKASNSSVSVIIPARNEAGNINTIINRVPDMGDYTEIVFVEGHSTDNTYETIESEIKKFPEKNCVLFQQTGEGKGDAVRLGFEKATGDILMILDTDMTVPPEDLTRFYNAVTSGKGEFINGVRLVYPMEDRAMRFLNILGNKFFSLMFSWLLGQPIKDTLCGTKVLRKNNYAAIAKNRSYFGNFDPFGDFDLLFGAAKLNLKIVEVPIRYRNRTYGDTNIDRWRHGWLLIKMVVFAAKRIKFI